LDDARHDRRHRREMRPDLGGQQTREAGLTGAGWAPQEERREVATGDAPAKRATLSDEVLLTDELVEVPRTHPRRQWLPLGRWLEQRLGFRATRLGSCGRHGPSLRGPNGPNEERDSRRADSRSGRSHFG